MGFLQENKSKIFSRDTFYILIIVVLGILFLFNGCGKDKENDDLRKEILKLDKTVQEANGSYKKLVNNFATEKELNKEVKEINKELAKDLKKNNEKLLMISTAVATFQNK